MLLYIFYKSEFVWGGNKRDYYFYYYLISLILILISLILIIKKIVLNEYFLIISFSVVFSLYLLEIYLNFLHPNFIKNQKIKKFNKHQSIEYDLRTRYEVYSDLKSKNYTITIPPSSHLNDKVNDHKFVFPLSGLSNKKTIFCNESGYFSKYYSDKYGFNNPSEEWDKEKQIILIGDSFVHGACVNEGKDLASNLRKFTQNGVLNLGYSGNSTLIQLATIREYLKKDSSKVILFFFENDLEELSFEIKNNFLIQYINDNSFFQNLKDKQKIVDNKNHYKIKKNISQKNNTFQTYLKWLSLEV